MIILRIDCVFFFQLVKGVKRYFQRFGEVESICMPSTPQSSFCFIQYKSSDAAKKALSKSSHRIANCMLTVRPAYVKHQPDYKQFKPPAQDAPHHILNALNDDCLRVIFKKFNLVDLSAAADVCVRFQLHATEAFKSMYKHTLKIDQNSTFKRHPDTFEVCLRNFGQLIHSLTIDHHILKTNPVGILETINKCAPALKDLELCHFEVSCSVDDVHLLFVQLEKLSLLHCTFTNGAEKLLASCAELKRLHVLNGDWDNSCIDRTFPQLEEVDLIECSTIDDAEFKRFISMNPALKKLSLRGNCELTANSIHPISELTSLVELQIEDLDIGSSLKFLKGTMNLSQLHSLQKLTLNNNGLTLTPLLAKLAENAVPLEHLSLKFGSINSNGIQKMSELMKLNAIEFENIEHLTDNHIIELAKELPQLRAVHLTGWSARNITTGGVRTMLEHAGMLSHLVLKRASKIQIDQNDYRAMLQTIHNRREKIKLTIELTGSGDKVNVSDELMATNRNRLWIDEKIEDQRIRVGLADIVGGVFSFLFRGLHQRDANLFHLD